MKNEYIAIATMIRTRHKDAIAEADTNPDKWYELFVSEGETGTHTVESADTFDEIAQYIETYAEQYDLPNINIDIWENRKDPNNLKELIETETHSAAETSPLTDGAAYTICLKNNRKVYVAIYHHCTLSGKHYFLKGDDVYPIEDVCPHGIKSYIALDEPPQIFRETNYGHQMEIAIQITYPYCKLNEVPDSVYGSIFNLLAENTTEATFDLEDVGDVVEGEMRRFSGSWRVVQLNQNLLARVFLWVNNYGDGEGLTRELFCKTYGKVMGDHYATKWESTYRHNIMAMVGYFGADSKDGQKFCDMLMQQMTKYEQRINAKRNERRT